MSWCTNRPFCPHHVTPSKDLTVSLNGPHGLPKVSVPYPKAICDLSIRIWIGCIPNRLEILSCYTILVWGIAKDNDIVSFRCS